MRGATCVNLRGILAVKVSIHAPHARGDQALQVQAGTGNRFNPRPSCEGRLGDGDVVFDNEKFQSTPLMRGATWGPFLCALDCVVSIHAPHARGDQEFFDAYAKAHVSIHAPHARGDTL